MHVSQTDLETLPGASRAESTTQVVDSSIRLVRLFAAFKASEGGSARSLLHVVNAMGPMRQSAVAEVLHTDPSTISRHVAELVADGLVERTADPADGRASLLGLTAEGTERVTAMRADRDASVAGALGDWSTEDIEVLGRGLERFAHDVRRLLER